MVAERFDYFAEPSAANPLLRPDALDAATWLIEPEIALKFVRRRLCEEQPNLSIAIADLKEAIGKAQATLDLLIEIEETAR